MRRGVLLVAALVIAGCSSTADEQVTVTQECKDSVQAHLNYDASWPFFDPTPTKNPDGSWYETGTVKAQNGFGATQTLHWVCHVTSGGDVTTTVG